LSRDIVSHETGHAIIDGVAPDLYNAVTPQSLALHEAMADLAALLLAFETNFQHPALEGVDLETLATSDWAAYEFANRNRKLLNIPEGRPFHVRPRLDVTKRYIRGVKQFEEVRECIFKVSWEEEERNKVAGVSKTRQVTVGTTIAIDWLTKTIRARLTSGYKPQRAARDAMLQQLDGGVDVQGGVQQRARSEDDCEDPEADRRLPLDAHGLQRGEELHRLLFRGVRNARMTAARYAGSIIVGLIHRLKPVAIASGPLRGPILPP
jgi:hypothetical protein